MKKVQSFSLHLIIVSLFLIGASACEKYKDKIAPDLNLTNKYCNIPYAVNYNWGFPGVVDNQTCIFASDSLIGNWQYIDSIYDNEGNLISSTNHVLNMIVDVNDTTYQSLILSGMCSSMQTELSVDKYGVAIVKPILDSIAGGQFLCGTQDTIYGSLTQYADSGMASYLLINFEIATPTGKWQHKGTAYKQ